jgi:hypothetical protein
MFTCVRLSTGGVQCWGANQSGQIGRDHRDNVGDDETPAGNGDAFTGGAVNQVVTGSALTCAVMTADASLKCWGSNLKGRAGQLDPTKLFLLPTALESFGGGVAKVSIANGSACALLNTGSLRCWGQNDTGQLGLGYKSLLPTDYVGGTADTLPHKLPDLRMFK